MALTVILSSASVALVCASSAAVAQALSGRIIFKSDRDGAGDEIYVMDENGLNQTRLTHNGATDSYAAWSPDGTKIAFMSGRDGDFEIYVMNADGSNQRRLTNSSGIDFGPTWSPDGSRIAFSSTRNGNFEIYVMNADGSGQTRLTNNAMDDVDPVWSPDGTRISFASRNTQNGSFEIYVMSANGANPVSITNNAVEDSLPAWSPDSAKIAFQSGRDGNFEIYVMNADGSAQTRLTNHPGNDFEPAWSPDGSRIAFSSTRDGNFEIYAMNADGSGQTRFTSHPGVDGQPDWRLTATPPAPSANTVQFQSALSGVGEQSPPLQVTVTRTGDLSGAASVRYSTQNGTASDRSDYLAAAGTLRFAPQESSKTITVFITNDLFAEAVESFTIFLSEPSGCVLGGPSTTTVQITSDDATSGQSPVRWNENFNAEFFVRQHYRDFFNREADASGLAFWTDQITSCGADTACAEIRRQNVSAAFFLSIEFQETGFLVYRIYKAAYGNLPAKPVPLTLQEFLPDTQQIGRGVQVGIGEWQRQLEENKQAYLDEFVARARFASVYPQSLTAAQFVDALNQNAGGALSQAERNDLVTRLGAGQLTRAQVLRAVAEDAELGASEKNRAFVLMQYFGYLRRSPDDQQPPDFSGYNFWLQKLNDHNGNFVSAEMVKSFLIAGEYIERFGL